MKSLEESHKDLRQSIGFRAYEYLLFGGKLKVCRTATPHNYYIENAQGEMLWHSTEGGYFPDFSLFTDKYDSESTIPEYLACPDRGLPEWSEWKLKPLPKDPPKPKLTLEQFQEDVRAHLMTIIRDEGTYRHLQFRKPDTREMSFELITWPGHLCYTGDMGTFVFSRVEDMFTFFRKKSDKEITINPGYWAEKALAVDACDGIREYSRERATEYVRESETYCEGTPEDRIELEDLLAVHGEFEVSIRHALTDFEINDEQPFVDCWEASFTESTFRYLWACYAIVWGICRYDEWWCGISVERTAPECVGCGEDFIKPGDCEHCTRSADDVVKE